MIRTYKYRIKDKRARKTLLRHAWACNQVWNWCVAHHKDAERRYRGGRPSQKWLSAFALSALCKGVGADLGIHQQTVQCVCDQFVKSRDQHKKCPKFRASFGVKRSLGWVPFQQQSRAIEDNSVTYRGRKYRFWGTQRRAVPPQAKGGFFVEDARGNWHVCFRVEIEQPDCLAGEIGIDLGLKDLATLSTGEKVMALKHFRQYEVALSTAQRARNKRRAKAIHAKIANARRDHHHKLSTRLAREYAFIAVGNVNASALKKTRMAKSVSDAGWSAFRNMLAYKAKQFVLVDERFTTQTCSSCGTLPPERPKGIAGLGIRSWVCSDCGASHDRDVNAALNILRIGRSVAPPVEGSWEIAA